MTNAHFLWKTNGITQLETRILCAILTPKDTGLHGFT